MRGTLGGTLSLTCAGKGSDRWLTGGGVVVSSIGLCVALGVEALDVVFEFDFAGLVNPGLDYN